jgi:hypothetical protein
MGISLCQEKKVIQTTEEEQDEPDSPDSPGGGGSSQLVLIHQNKDKRDPHIKVTSRLMMRPVELKIVTDKGIGVRPLTVAPKKSVYICDVIPTDDGKMFDISGNTASSFKIVVTEVGRDRGPEEWEVSNAENPKFHKLVSRERSFFG